MNNRLLHGLLIFSITCSAVLGCAGPTSRNPALFSGGQSALTNATQDAIDNSDTSSGTALGGLKPTQKTTTADRILAPFKSVGNSLKPQSIPDATNDPISLNNKVNAPSPELFLSAARVIAGGGNLEQARELYLQALVAHPEDRDALLELARIEVQLKEYESATDRYMTAVQAHQDDPVVFNDLGLFHSEQENWDLAVKAFTRSIELDGERKLYRNNLANAWVQAGRPDLALEQLSSVHEKPQAHYNLGYLLYNSRQFLPAVEQFELAFQADQRFSDAMMMRNQVLQEIQRTAPQSPNRFVRPATFQEPQGAEKPVATQTSATEDDQAEERSVIHAAGTRAIETPAPSTNESVQAAVNDEATEPNSRIIIVREEEPQPAVVSTRLSDVEEPSRPTPHAAVPSPAPARIEVVTEGQPQTADTPDVAATPAKEEDAAEKVFVKYEKNWMPMCFYSVVEMSIAHATSEDKEKYWNDESSVEPHSEAEPQLLNVDEGKLKPVQADEPTVLRPITESSTPTTNGSGSTFERSRATPQYYPTTGAPAIKPKTP